MRNTQVIKGPLSLLKHPLGLHSSELLREFTNQQRKQPLIGGESLIDRRKRTTITKTSTRRRTITGKRKKQKKMNRKKKKNTKTKKQKKTLEVFGQKLCVLRAKQPDSESVIRTSQQHERPEE